MTNMWLLPVLIALISAAQADDTCEHVVLRAAVGMDAVLPCGQGRVFLDGPKAYTIWTKSSFFLQRFPPSPENWTMTSTLDCVGHSCHDPTSLKIMNVGFEDTGVYRCRIDYERSPRTDFFIELKIIHGVAPPRIYNNDNDVSGGVLHLALDSSTELTCEAESNRGQTLTWWERNGLVIKHEEVPQNGLLVTKVLIKKANRGDLNAHYECLAQNADVTAPLMTSVVIKMNLAPISIEIRLDDNMNFEAGVPRVADCIVIGCMPPPDITWHLGEGLLRSNVHKEQHKGNYTISSLTLAPSLRDDQHELTCRAHNSNLPKKIYETKVVVNVGFRPVCVYEQLQAVIGFVSDKVEVVRCTLDAHPEPKGFTWTFPDGKILHTSVEKVEGYLHRYTSQLTWKPYEGDTGTMACGASHLLGKERTPCYYTLIPGGVPLEPICNITVNEDLVFNVRCEKAWDGGRPQTVHLEARNREGILVYNETSIAGRFIVNTVNGHPTTAQVYSSSSRGRSRMVTLQLEEAKDGIKRSEENEARVIVFWIIIVGCVIIVLTLGALSCCKSKMSRASLCTDQEPQELDEIDPELAYSNGSFRREAQPCNPVVMEAMERMPLNENIKNGQTKTVPRAVALASTTAVAAGSPAGCVVITTAVNESARFTCLGEKPYSNQ